MAKRTGVAEISRPSSPPLALRRIGMEISSSPERNCSAGSIPRRTFAVNFGESLPIRASGNLCAIQCVQIEVTHFGNNRCEAPPLDALLFGVRPVLYYLLRLEYLRTLKTGGAHRCANEFCRQFFLRDREGQQFCSEECSRKQRQRNYWQTKGSKRRRKRRGGRKILASRQNSKLGGRPVESKDRGPRKQKTKTRRTDVEAPTQR